MKTKLKEKAMELGRKLKSAAKSTLAFMLEYTLAVVIISSLALLTLKLPEFQNKWLRSSVGSKVYMIKDHDRSGGGTGFAITAPSGQSYILTNDHVCEVSSDKQTVLVQGDDVSMRRRIIAHDPNSDLCLIEGIPGVKGLDVAGDAPQLGDTVTVVGHPRLLPMHTSHGEMMGREDVTIMMGPISIFDSKTGKEEFISPKDGGVTPAQCSMNKHSQSIMHLDLMFFVIKVKFCFMTVKQAYNTSTVIHPGNSGSPVVNFWGNVTGVAFASDRSTTWARIVPLEDVNSFLKNY